MLNDASNVRPVAESQKPKKTGLPGLMRELVDSDDDDDLTSENTVHRDPLHPWLDEFELYYDSREYVPSGTSMVSWWGVRIHISVDLQLKH